MNDQFTTDAAIAAKWAAAQDDGNAPALSVTEIDRLIALTPANAAVALADLADARAIEVEISGDPNATDDNDIDDDCVACDGTGLGMYDGARCSMCGGSGCAHDAPLFDEPYDLDEAAFDAYMCDAFAAAVA